MNRDAQALADHAAGIAQPLAAVERDLDRQRMQDLGAVGARLRPGERQGMGHVARADRPAAQLDVDGGHHRLRAAAGDPEHDLAHRAPGLLLGLVHHRQDRRLGCFRIDDRARAQAFGELIAAALQLEAVAAPARDQAAHLAGADIKYRQRLGTRARFGPRQLDHVARAHVS
jgi:hypothetical protein